MIVAALSMFALATAGEPSATPSASVSSPPGWTQRLAGRPEARIPFARNINGFRGEREDGEDIVYLESGINDWYRAEVQCFGLGEPRFAHAVAPLDRGFGVDRFTRLALFEFGDRHPTECRVERLVRLTRDEAVELKLAPKPRAAR